VPPGFDVRAYPSPARELEAYHELAELLAAAAGAQLLGGCCGTTPQHIGALKERLGR
jgi:methionine synthase I (cobalamin-dependent)